MNQRERILKLLKRRGHRGVSTLELRDIAPQYNARIYELRHGEHYYIEMFRRDPNGVCWYRLVS